MRGQEKAVLHLYQWKANERSRTGSGRLMKGSGRAVERQWNRQRKTQGKAAEATEKMEQWRVEEMWWKGGGKCSGKASRTWGPGVCFIATRRPKANTW